MSEAGTPREHFPVEPAVCDHGGMDAQRRYSALGFFVPITLSGFQTQAGEVRGSMPNCLNHCARSASVAPLASS